MNCFPCSIYIFVNPDLIPRLYLMPIMSYIDLYCDEEDGKENGSTLGTNFRCDRLGLYLLCYSAAIADFEISLLLG